MSEHHDWTVYEVEATPRQNTRAKLDKTYHMLVSFRAGENPSPEVLQMIEERLCESLGSLGQSFRCTLRLLTARLRIG